MVSAYSSVALTELWILYNMVSLTIWRRCCRQGGLLQFLEHVHDARGVVVAPEDIYISGGSSLYSLIFISGALGMVVPYC